MYWTQVIYSDKWLNWLFGYAVQPPLSTDVTTPMGRGRHDMFLLSYIILRNNYCMAYIIHMGVCSFIIIGNFIFLKQNYQKSKYKLGPSLENLSKKLENQAGNQSKNIRKQNMI